MAQAVTSAADAIQTLMDLVDNRCLPGDLGEGELLSIETAAQVLETQSAATGDMMELFRSLPPFPPLMPSQLFRIGTSFVSLCRDAHLYANGLNLIHERGGAPVLFTLAAIAAQSGETFSTELRGRLLASSLDDLDNDDEPAARIGAFCLLSELTDRKSVV